MRPIKLELEGFTSFRERTELDFTELDLFAITGPTGAGKTSLLDAMTYALYGKTTRVGNRARELMSHGAKRLMVCFQFSAGAERYSVLRVLEGSATTVRLERHAGGGLWQAVAGKTREIEQEVSRVAGLGFEAFTRAVILPQGEFDEFLRGDKAGRREILAGLLNLGIYDEMKRLANDRAKTLARDAAWKRGLIKEEATQEARAGLTGEIGRLMKEEARLEGRLKRLQREAFPLAFELRELRKSEREAEGERERLRRAVETARKACQQVEQRKPAKPAGERALEKRCAKAEARMKDTQARLEHWRRVEAAGELRRHLSVGEVCPVCLREVAEIPKTAAVAWLEKASREHKEAVAERDQAWAALLKKRSEAAAEQMHRGKTELAAERAKAVVLERQLGVAAKAAQRIEKQGLKLKEKWAALAEEFQMSGWDEAAAAERGQKALGALLEQVRRQRAASQSRLENLDSQIAENARLREEAAELERAAELNRQLGTLLNASNFQQYLLGESVERLAHGGSEHLLGLSGGRYTFQASGDDFLVVDHWNAGETRPVNTLSGGESFVASLALALALAGSIADLGGERGVAALESLFLDEGFSTLDNDTLAKATETLQMLENGERLIGVITHLPSLAEQMPARVEVERTVGGSRLRVVVEGRAEVAGAAVALVGERGAA
jgi:exonuclease SbcC